MKGRFVAMNNVTKRKGKIFIIGIILVIVIGCVGYYKIINNSNKQAESSDKQSSNNTDKEERDKNNNTKVDFDFDELENTLYSSIQKEEIVPFISKCESKASNTDEPPKTELYNTEVSSNTINTIINKLKTATSIEQEITYSWFGCPPKAITYYISVNSTNKEAIYNQTVFALNYANANNILLVQYNKKGYAFHFNSDEEINNFIETLS